MSQAKSSLPVQLLAAAVVGALASFGVAKFMQPSDPAQPPPADQRLIQVLEKVDQLEGRLQTSEHEAAKSRAELVRVERDLHEAIASNATGLNGQGQTVSKIERLQTSTNEAVQDIQTSYKGLNGRIEGNYTTLRNLDRRLKKLEAQ